VSLTPKQQLFIAEYLVDLNATQAALRAGYKPRAAKQQGTENLAKPAIQEAIQAALKARIGRTKVTQDRVLKEVACLAFHDPRKFFREDGSPIPIHELDDDTAAALAGLTVSEQYEGSGQDRQFVGYLKAYKLGDKLGALVSLMKHLGMITSRHEITGKDGGPIEHKHEVPAEGKEALDTVYGSR
jgi:phage terminase small subunit